MMPQRDGPGMALHVTACAHLALGELLGRLHSIDRQKEVRTACIDSGYDL